MQIIVAGGKCLCLDTFNIATPFITLFCRGDFTLVQNPKIKINVQDNVMITILDIPVFPNVDPFKTFHVHQCEPIFQIFFQV